MAEAMSFCAESKKVHQSMGSPVVTGLSADYVSSTLQNLPVEYNTQWGNKWGNKWGSKSGANGECFTVFGGENKDG